MLRFGKWLILVCMLALATGASVMAQDTEPRPYRIVVVTHGQASDPFWSVVKRGVDDAACAEAGDAMDHRRSGEPVGAQPFEERARERPMLPDVGLAEEDADQLLFAIEYAHGHCPTS